METSHDCCFQEVESAQGSGLDRNARPRGQRSRCLSNHTLALNMINERIEMGHNRVEKKVGSKKEDANLQNKTSDSGTLNRRRQGSAVKLR